MNPVTTPPHEMEPLFPDFAPLRGRAERVVADAANLGRHLHPATLDAVAELLRTINCYYSNLIEGHDTHPIEIERAMRSELSNAVGLRDLQIEARAHIEVQRLIERRLDAAPTENVCAPAFLRWIHREFYVRLHHEMRLVRHPTEPMERLVMPGELRDHGVRVGDHVAPRPAELPALLERFAAAYDPASCTNGADRALANLGAAHHRLLWIHPFGDGNGRVARLMTDAYLRRIGIGGHGLWTVSRGLARARSRYREALANADGPRWNDLDGRGALSLRALDRFCEFFLDVCGDQISSMSGLLAVDGLLGRVSQYGRLREQGIGAPERSARAAGDGSPARSARGRKPVPWKPEGTRLLRAIVAEGPLARADARSIIGLPDRTARRLVAQLTEEGFLTAESHRSSLAVRFPAHAVPYLFPGLYDRGE